MNLKDIISIDDEVLSGQTVFKGTRVPIDTLFDHLESGITIDSFLDDFPSVTKEQAIALLEFANKLFNTKNINQLYEAVA
jgi:uncharacterized protein (DUF433 family)